MDYTAMLNGVARGVPGTRVAVEEINARLREMKQIEKQMNTTRMQVLKQRQVEDADWYQQVQAHDAEEARLRNRKRYLSYTAPRGAEVLETGSPDTPGSPTTPSSRKTPGRRGPRVGDPRFRLPSSFDAEGRPLWKRRSDGRHVYVMCPGKDCGKINHKSIHGFLAHVRRSHPTESRVLGPGQMNAIEECSVLPERFRRWLASHDAGSDHTSSVGRDDATGLSVQDGDEELQIKEEPVEETGEGVDQELDIYEEDADLHTKLWVETSSGLQARAEPDTVNAHGKRGRSVSSDDEPFKRSRPEIVFPREFNVGTETETVVHLGSKPSHLQRPVSLLAVHDQPPQRIKN